MSRGSGRSRLVLLAVGTLAGSLLATRQAQAWTFPEHTQITRLALDLLGRHTTAGPHVQEVLREVVVGLKLSVVPGKRAIDFAVLPSLAGDHSCTPFNLRTVVANAQSSERWVLDVLDVADETQKRLYAAAADGASREAVRRWMHVEFQRNDSRYLERAEVDYSHFQLERAGNGIGIGIGIGIGKTGLEDYMGLSFSPGSRANATAAYANYHVAALRLAVAAAVQPKQRQDFLARAFVAEAFALHFLEDSFSSGHFVGHWGDQATRQGTHDFYSGAAVEAKTWGDPSSSYVAHGDAFLSDAERERIATLVAESLSQVVLAAVGQTAPDMVKEQAFAFVAEDYDSCKESLVPMGLGPLASSSSLRQILADEPVPSRRNPEVPRMRLENGFFVGVAAMFQGGHGFTGSGLNGHVGVGLRLGLGLAGLVNDPLNAQAFVEPGLVGAHEYGDQSQSLIGYSLRIRALGYVSLVDGIIGIALAQGLRSKCPACIEFAAASAGGGFLRLWREMHLTARLSWQFAAFRDVTAIWYRRELDEKKDRLEVLLPALTARYYFPISSGTSWSQSTDMYFDMGPSLTWDPDHSGALGVFGSFSVAARMFP